MRNHMIGSNNCVANIDINKQRGWSPFDITTYAWHDASNADTITIETGVSQWDDVKGNGLNVIQSTASKQPSVALGVANSLNGLPTIKFQKAFNEFLSLENHSLFTTKTMHFLIVARAITVANNGESFVSLNGGGGDWEIRAHESPQFDGLLRTANFPPSDDASYNQTDVTDWAMWGAEFIEETEFSSWFNGVQQTVKATTGKLDITIVDYRFAINREKSLPCHCLIAECVVFAPDDREEVEGYLADKWGLQSSLPVSHPYRYAPPVAPQDI